MTALADPRLQAVASRPVDPFAGDVGNIGDVLAVPDDADGRLRGAALGVRQQVLARLPELLERFADTAMRRGIHIYWASTAVEARDYVARVVQAHDARYVVTSTSMSTVIDEIQLRAALEARGTEVVDTDRQPVHDLLSGWAGPDGVVGGVDAGEDALVGDATSRDGVREAIAAAQVGITGASLAVAETGSIVLVSDDGHGRLVASLPRAHVVVLGTDQLVASWDQADLLLGLKARSISGQRTSWPSSTIVTGPRRTGELGGPDELHVVVLDDGRSGLLAGSHDEMLGCARCGGYQDVGLLSHRVGAWTPRWPMGAGLGPLLWAEGHRPVAGLAPVAAPTWGASLHVGRGESPSAMLLSLRHDQVDAVGREPQAAWRLWATAWSDPRRYDTTTRAATWERLATGLGGRLPVPSSWIADPGGSKPATERFRDRWRKGLV